MKAKLVNDKDYVKEVRQAIKANDGYCPCQLLHNDDTRCMCKDFIENVPVGEECLCGLYIKCA